MSWHLSGSVEEFADAAGDFLRSRPVEHTVPLTLVDSLRRDGPHVYGSGDPLFGWYRDADGSVAGACLQTPPFPLLITAAPDVAELAGRLADRPLPGVNARAGDVDEFVAAWRQLTGATAVPGRQSRLYRLDALTPPSLDAGAVDVVLFTDLANPTSNALYQRLGYRPVEDRAVVEFR